MANRPRYDFSPEMVEAGFLPGVIFTYADFAELDPQTHKALPRLQRFLLNEDGSATPLKANDPRPATFGLGPVAIQSIAPTEE